ncbi:MAG: hypothetical protein WD749_15300 [Phycisphaerales bacterium]
MRARPLKLLAFLAAGAALAVVASWVLLATSRLHQYAGQASPWPRGTPADWPRSDGTIYRTGRGVRITRVISSDAPFLPTTPSWTKHEASVIEAGWPVPCVRSFQASTETATGRTPAPPRPDAWTAGLHVPWATFLPMGAVEQPRLPIRPVPLGFAVNAAVWGGLAWLALRIPLAVRWCYRRRCGLCAGCGFPAGAPAICTECGRTVRPWSSRGRPVRAYTPRVLRLAARACLVSIVVAAALYAASGWASFYLKGPGGWYGAVWQGNVALGRSATAFRSLGLEASPHGGYRLLFRMPSQLVGAWVCLPLWIPVPALAAIGLAAWWHAAVRSGLALHWPPPQASGGAGAALPSDPGPA